MDERAALGIRRLNVIDLVTGDQPQANEDRTVWTIFNGEIYNFADLRDRLTRRGHRLVTASDTETIVHLYEDHGEGFVEHLEGMFAIAVWDAARRKLVLARDRMGKKPLLYWERHGELAFASEHWALLASLPERPEVAFSAIRQYLRLGFVPAPHDAFEGVRKIPPGHLLVWSDGQTRLRRYWHPPAAGELLAITEAEAAAELRRLFDNAVRRRLVADVPIGALLSGGVDSSAVVATMARLSAKVRTFTIDFAESDYSESLHARRIAQRFGTEHHEFAVRPSAMDVLPLLVRHYGEPFADSSAVPTYYVSELTRQYVTVALNGDGGDELFAGYERYQAVRVAAMLDQLPAWVRRPPMTLLGRTLRDSASPSSRLRRLRRFASAAMVEPGERYLRWVGVFDRDTLDPLLDKDFSAHTQGAESDLVERVGEAFTRAEPIDAAQRVDLQLYLPDDLLVKADIASMANSLELRSPFLDREIVEFAMRLPLNLRIRGSDRKYLIKRAFADVVPRENMYRRKQGFAVPIGAWFKAELRDLLRDTLCSQRARGRGYFNPEQIARLVDDHIASRADHAHRLWALLVLELWHREFID